MKYLILTLLFFNFTIGVCFPQTEIQPINKLKKDVKLLQHISTKQGTYIDSISAVTVDLIEKIDGSNKKITQLQSDVNKLFELDDTRKNQLETSLTIFENTNGSIGNGLAYSSYIVGLFGFIVAIIAIWITNYISRKEQSFRDTLAKVEEAERQSIAVKDLIEKDVTAIYKKLKTEEQKDIISKIESNPSQMRAHLSRLLTLDVSTDEFPRFKNMLFSWESKDDTRMQVEFLLIFLVNQYPKLMAANEETSPTLLKHWSKVLQGIEFTELEVFVDEYVKAFLENKYPEAAKQLSFVLKPLGDLYNTWYIANKMLFDKYVEKNDRLKLLNLLKEHEVGNLLSFYEPRYNEAYGISNNPSPLQGLPENTGSNP